MRKLALSDTPCPRCGCHVTFDFECNCSAVHETCCENCGRFRAIPPDQEIGPLPSDFDLPPLWLDCEAPGLHRHRATPQEYLNNRPTRDQFMAGVPVDL